MTEEHKASRTIVKSPPELWAECSVAQSLARHLGEFGEIRITRLEPETTVAWEGEHASGTVRLEPSGWGTQVTLTVMPVVAAVPAPAVEPEPAVEPPPAFEPELVVEPPPSVEPELAVEPPPSVEPEPELVEYVEETEDHSANERYQGPRWQVFARLWARLGRRSHDAQDEPAEDQVHEPEAPEAVRAPVNEPEAPEAVRALASEPVVQAPPEPVVAELEAVVQEPEQVPQLDHQALLVGALDSLGQAHHRPFSRA